MVIKTILWQQSRSYTGGQKTNISEDYLGNFQKKENGAKILTKGNFLKKESKHCQDLALNRLRFPSAQCQEMSLEASLRGEL